MLTTTITTDWRDLASCRDSEPTLFFPVGTTGPAVDQIDAAIAICSTCLVQEDCLQYALETNQESGVWGGYAEDDRRRLRIGLLHCAKQTPEVRHAHPGPGEIVRIATPPSASW